MKKYNLSNIMKRAWELVKKAGMNISSGLKEAWKEAKKTEENIVKKLVANLGEMAYGCIYINAGIDRQVATKVWEKNGQKRTYLKISCYSLAGRLKGTYECGYVDMLTNKYVCTKYDAVNAETMEYIGR